MGTGAPSTSSGGGRSDPLNLNQVWCGYQRLTIIKNNHKIIDTSVSISNQFVALYALITLLDGARMEPGGDSGNGGAEIVRFIGGFVRKFQGGFFWGILVSTVILTAVILEMCEKSANHTQDLANLNTPLLIIYQQPKNWYSGNIYPTHPLKAANQSKFFGLAKNWVL